MNNVSMATLTSIRKRSFRSEIMDDPALPPDSHEKALKGLERINWVSHAGPQIFSALKTFAKERPYLKILDVATGGGDIPIRLWELARREGLLFDVYACDKSETALQYAKDEARKRRVPVRFFQLDVSRDPFPAGFDVIVSSLFLHHLSLLATRRFLKNIAAASRQGFILNDLQRTLPGLVAAEAGCRLLSSSPVVRQDGPQSVRAAYTMPEIRRLAQQAGLEHVSIQTCWPFRYQMIWKRHDS